VSLWLGTTIRRHSCAEGSGTKKPFNIVNIFVIGYYLTWIYCARETTTGLGTFVANNRTATIDVLRT
jgi:hypothetical protein